MLIYLPKNENRWCYFLVGWCVLHDFNPLYWRRRRKKSFKDEIFETPHFSGTFKITRFELRKMTTAILASCTSSRRAKCHKSSLLDRCLGCNFNSPLFLDGGAVRWPPPCVSHWSEQNKIILDIWQNLTSDAYFTFVLWCLRFSSKLITTIDYYRLHMI